jgi:hypothetical protein
LLPIPTGTSRRPQGRWQIHGLGLPDDALRRVDRDNAIGLIQGIG